MLFYVLNSQMFLWLQQDSVKSIERNKENQIKGLEPVCVCFYVYLVACDWMIGLGPNEPPVTQSKDIRPARHIQAIPNLLTFLLCIDLYI